MNKIKPLIIILIVLFSFLLVACSEKPEVLSKDSIQSSLQEYFTNMENESEGKVRYTVKEMIDRKTEGINDVISFEVTVEERGGIMTMTTEPLETGIITTSIFQVDYQYDKKANEWIRNTVEKIEDKSTLPTQGINDITYFSTIGRNSGDSSEYWENEVIDRDTDLSSGTDKILVKKTSQPNSFVSESGTVEYTFEFDEEKKAWKEINTVEQDDWKVDYNIIGIWELAEEMADGKFITFEIKSVSNEGELLATFNSGYENSMSHLYDEYVNADWSGKTSIDNKFIFNSDSSSLQLEIPKEANASGIYFDGHLFKRAE